MLEKKLLRGWGRAFVLAGASVSLAGASVSMLAQAPQPPADSSPASAAPQPPPRGQVLIESHGTPPSLPTTGKAGTPAEATATQLLPLNPSTPGPLTPTAAALADLTDADRSALLITAYDLDLRLRPEDAGLSARARLTVKNTGGAPLKQLALQISSSLRWESATLVTSTTTSTAPVPLPVLQHRLETDADHTGAETELILTLPEPLPPAASVHLDLFYTGTVPPSAARLQRLGATAAQGRNADWDAISPKWTGLRGFGNVLWYPVASPQLFFAEGNTLFGAVGRTKLREQEASVRLRLGVEYSGEAPVAAYFCGRRQPLTVVTDSPNSPTETGTGLATAAFGAELLGFRTLNLFLLEQPEIFADPQGAPTIASTAIDRPASSSRLPEATPDAPTASTSSSSSSTSSDSNNSSSSSLNAQTAIDPVLPLLRRGGALSADARPFLALEGADSEAVHQFSAASFRSSAVLRRWLGPEPLSALTAIEHDGQPFQDGPFLVAPLPVLAQPTAAPALTQTLTHAWVQTGQPWIDDGLAQFFALLFTEQQSGRETAIAQLDDLMKPVALAEPDPTAKSPSPNAEPLIAASSELIYRRKAAAVWWMLRGVVGNGNLHAALNAWCTQPVSTDPPEAQALAFEHLLERVSHQDLGWFFNDWVLADKGLPDLTIGDIAVVEEPTGPGHPAGWLVAVTVRNEGGAVADVPLVVHSGPLSTARRVRLPGQATLTERVLVEAAPTSVTLNDGGTPEQRNSTHTSDVHLRVR